MRKFSRTNQELIGSIAGMIKISCYDICVFVLTSRRVTASLSEGSLEQEVIPCHILSHIS